MDFAGFAAGDIAIGANAHDSFYWFGKSNFTAGDLPASLSASSGNAVVKSDESPASSDPLTVYIEFHGIAVLCCQRQSAPIGNLVGVTGFQHLVDELGAFLVLHQDVRRLLDTEHNARVQIPFPIYLRLWNRRGRWLAL